jgi:hypothetical protein
MRITESKLRKIVRQEILREGVNSNQDEVEAALEILNAVLADKKCTATPEQLAQFRALVLSASGEQDLGDVPGTDNFYRAYQSLRDTRHRSPLRTKRRMVDDAYRAVTGIDVAHFL